MKNGILTLLFLSLLSCMPEEELPMKDMGETGPHRHLFLFRFQGDKLRHDQLPNLIQSHAELLYI